MLLEQIRLDDYVISIDFNILPDHPLEDFIHQTLICGLDIFLFEGHDLIEVVGIIHHEGCLLFFSWVHAYLIIPRVSVIAVVLLSNLYDSSVDLSNTREMIVQLWSDDSNSSPNESNSNFSE